MPADGDVVEEEQPEEEERTDDEELVMEEPAEPEVNQETMDRCKKAKFLKLLDDGSLPEWLEEEWQKACKLKTGKRAKQREIVNSAIDRSGVDSKLVLNVNKPIFQNMQVWKKVWFVGSFHVF